MYPLGTSMPFSRMRSSADRTYCGSWSQKTLMLGNSNTSRQHPRTKKSTHGMLWTTSSYGRAYTKRSEILSNRGRARFMVVMTSIRQIACDVASYFILSLGWRWSLPRSEITAMSDESQTPAILPVSCSFSSISLGDDLAMCRICHNTGGKENEPLQRVCWCKGTMGDVHKSCLEAWLSSVYSDRCPICHYHFRTKRVFKPIRQVICRYLKWALFFPISLSFIPKHLEWLLNES